MKLDAISTKNEARFVEINTKFGNIQKNLAEMDARIEGRFELVEQRFESQDFKIDQSVTSAANKLMIMMLVIAGSIIASLLYGG